MSPLTRVAVCVVFMQLICSLISSNQTVCHDSQPRQEVRSKQAEPLAVQENYRSAFKNTEIGTGVVDYRKSPGKIAQTLPKSPSYSNSGPRNRQVVKPSHPAGDYLLSVAHDEGVSRWPQERLPLKVFVAQGRNVRAYRPSFRAELLSALNEWVTASAGRISFRLVQSPAEADIVCRWTDRAAPGTSDEAGYTESTLMQEPSATEFGIMNRSVVTILTHDYGRPLSENDIRKVCLHELGHALGYQGHSPFSSDIMYQCDTPSQGYRLSARDVASIRNLYSYAN